MRLRDLDSGQVKPTVILLQTSSTRMTLYLQDKIKAKYGCKVDDIIDVQSKKDYKKIKDIMHVTPPFASMWFIPINLDKMRDKDLISLMRQASTCVFFCTCSKYSTYKKFKEEMKGIEGVFDFYINYLRRNDFIYLYDAFTLSDNKLSKQLFDYVVQGYSGDIDTVFELLMRLNKGEIFDSRRSIIDVCGLGGLSIESFVFSMMKPLSGSAKGLQLVIRNRMRAGLDLGDELGYIRMFNFMSSCIISLCEIKMLMISGVVYKEIRSLPDNYNEKALSRYQKYIWRLNSIPMSDLLLLRSCMGGKAWYRSIDLINFIYSYYSKKGAKLCQ